LVAKKKNMLVYLMVINHEVPLIFILFSHYNLAVLPFLNVKLITIPIAGYKPLSLHLFLYINIYIYIYIYIFDYLLITYFNIKSMLSLFLINDIK